MKTLMKIFLSLAFACIVATFRVEAQSVTSESISFKLEDVTEMFMPPDLRMNIKFIDDNNNNILEAEERGYILLEISNRGGKADNVKVTVTPADRSYGVDLGQSVINTYIDKNSSTEVHVPMTASLNVPTGFTKFNIVVSEPMGYDINATLELSTFEFQRARLNMNGVEISDSGDNAPYAAPKRTRACPDAGDAPDRG